MVFNGTFPQVFGGFGAGAGIAVRVDMMRVLPQSKSRLIILKLFI